MVNVNEVVEAVKEKTIRTHCPSGAYHTFRIIKGSGRKTGTSTWKCIHCNHKVKSM